MGFIDSSVVNVALPVLQQDLQTDLTTIQWVVNAYLLTLASLILIGGSAGDRYGLRNVFIFGLVGFAASSLACGLAPSANYLIAARLVQGAAAAFLIPASLALIGAAYSGEERGSAIGTWAAAGAITTALGPPLGGWLVDTIGWRAIFYINLPIAVIALTLALKLPPDKERSETEPLDVAGAALVVVALGLLSYGLIAIRSGGTFTGMIAIGLAVAAGWFFIRVEQRVQAPMMPLALFRNCDFSGANALTLLLYAALSGSLFLLPYVLIDAHGYSATAAGAAFLPFSVIMGAGSRWSGGLAERIGARLPLVIGPCMTAAGYLLLAVSVTHSNYWIGFFPGLVLVGLGMTLSVAPLTTTVLDAAPDDMGGSASGINNAVARTGSLLAIAALGFAFQGTDMTKIDAAALEHGYRLVMIAAGVLAGLGALIAALSISPGKKWQEGHAA